MELRYIWVEDYRVLKNIGFNFNHTGQHLFNYEQGELKLQPNNNRSILDFGEKITSVTAIAGENGSGKSSLVELIIRTTATYSNGGLSYDMIFKGIVCYFDHVFHFNQIVINNKEELEKSGYKVISFNESPFEEMSRVWHHSFQQGAFIYYSNYLDFRSYLDFDNLKNISTAFYLIEDWKYNPNFIRPNLTDTLSKSFVEENDLHSAIRIFNDGQSFRWTKFYVNNSDLIPFNHPEEFVISPTYPGSNKWIKIHWESLIDSHLDECMDSILNVLFRKHFPENENEDNISIQKEIYHKVIRQLYRLNIVLIKNHNNVSLSDLELVDKFIFNEESAKDLFVDYDIIDKYLDILKRFLESSSKGPLLFSPAHSKRNRENYRDWRFYLIEGIFVKVSQHTIEEVGEFILLEERICNEEKQYIRRISNYYLSPEFSSGESSFLTFFSRLYDAIEMYDKGNHNIKQLILLIDEGDVAFHPYWKKKFFNWIVTWLNNINSRYTFQLLITTHSPYLLSDLPSNNVLLLRKSQAGTEIIPASAFSTFGANIYDILANSFFLKDGNIGEFAKEKVQWVIDTLNGWRDLKKIVDVNELEKQKVFKLISIIGDTVVRNKLFEMYWEIFSDESALNNEIDSLNRRIEDLKKRLK
ncbi:MAG: AAA family ATPase [Bacteroidota bacterium]